MPNVDKKKIEEPEEPELDDDEEDDDEEEEDDDEEDDSDDDGELTPADVAQQVAQALRDAHESCESATAERGKSTIILDLDDGSQWRLIVKRVGE